MNVHSMVFCLSQHVLKKKRGKRNNVFECDYPIFNLLRRVAECHECLFHTQLLCVECFVHLTLCDLLRSCQLVSRVQKMHSVREKQPFNFLLEF